MDITAENNSLTYISNNTTTANSFPRTLPPYNFEFFDNSSTSHNNTTAVANNQRRTLPYSNEFRVTLLFLYSIVFVFGLIGNLMTCVAVITVRTMRRSIHFYLFNLAVADLLLLFLYVPTQMVFVRDYMSWEMGKDMCIVAFGIICLCLTASIGTLVSISVDRYRGILRPFDWRAASTRNAKIVIPLIWLSSAVIAAPLSYHGNVGQNTDGTNVCYENWSMRDGVIYWSSIMVIQYVLPLIFITVVHLHMAFIVSRQKQQNISELHKRMIRMVIMLLLTYSICNGMQHVNFYLSVYMNIHNKSFGSYLFLFSNFAISLQAAINPLIYGISRNDYQNVFKFILSSYAGKIFKLLKCFTSATDGNDNGAKAQETQLSDQSEQTMIVSEGVGTPSFFKKDIIVPKDQTCKKTLNKQKSTHPIMDIGEAIIVKEVGFAKSQKLLEIPSPRRKKVSVSEAVSRSDTMYYTNTNNPNEDIDKKRSMRKKNRKAKIKKWCSEDLANQMVPQVVTSNQNHPIIVVTDYENQNGDPSGRYGTIIERDCLELTTPVKSNNNSNDNDCDNFTKISNNKKDIYNRNSNNNNNICNISNTNNNNSQSLGKSSNQYHNHNSTITNYRDYKVNNNISIDSSKSEHYNAQNRLLNTTTIGHLATAGNNSSQISFRRNLFSPYSCHVNTSNCSKDTATVTVKESHQRTSKRGLFSSHHQPMLNTNSKQRLSKKNMFISIDPQDKPTNRSTDLTNDDVWLFRNYPESVRTELLDSSLESTI